MQGTRQGHHAKVEHTVERLNEGDQAAAPKVHRRGRPDRLPGVGRIAADCAPPVVHDQQDDQRHQQPEGDR
jgi:hypothetical protein